MKDKPTVFDCHFREGKPGKIQRQIVLQVLTERMKQDREWGVPESRPDAPWLAILLEEVGEVARATLGNKDAGSLRDELIQVAAVSLAWLESCWFGVRDD